MERSEGTKKPLTNPVRVGYFDSIAFLNLTRYNCQECVIENYSDIKRNTNYSMTKVEGFIERTLKLHKTKHTHNFKFQCELNNRALQCLHPEDDMRFLIMYDRNRLGCIGLLRESDSGYCIDIPNELVLHADNKYLHEHNKLVIMYVYGSLSLQKPVAAGIGKVTKQDRAALSKDLLFLKESKKFSDFEIAADKYGTRLHVHKAICGIYMPVVEPEFQPSFFPRDKYSADIAVRFMYEGKLPDLSVFDLAGVAYFAKDLNMTVLKELVELMMMKKLNRDTFLTIRITAEVLQMDKLVNFAHKFQEIQKF